MTQDVLLKKEICKNFMLPNEKLPQAEGAAVRYVKAVRLLEKQSGLRDGAGWERAWKEWMEREGAPVLSVEAVAQLMRRYAVDPAIFQDLATFLRETRGGKVDARLWGYVIRYSGKDGAPADWRTWRLRALARLAQAAAQGKEGEAILGCCEQVLKCGYKPGRPSRLVMRWKRGDGSMVQFLVEQVAAMAKQGCAATDICGVVQRYIGGAARETRTATPAQDAAFFADFQRLIPVETLTRCTPEAVRAMRWIYRRRPNLFRALPAIEPGKWDGDRIVWAMFTAFRVPPSFVNRLLTKRLDSEELCWFEHMLLGGSLQSAPGLPFPVTRKVAHAFLHYPDSEMHLNLTEMLVFLTLQVRTGDVDYAMQSSRIRWTPGSKVFWLETLTFLHGRGVGAHEVMQVIDYIAAVHVVGGRPIQWRTQTARSLMVRVHDWHMSAFSRAFWNYPNYTLPLARIEGVDLEKHGFPYAINQIRSTRSLFNEGRMLQHCVFSYHSHCREGRCYIFSMKVRKESGKWAHTLTIEVEGKRVVQVRGLRNRLPTLVELEAVQFWAFRAGYSVAEFLPRMVA
ncbi:MAG: hypothetical protein RJA19_1896 [Bacteroidota bacterium]